MIEDGKKPPRQLAARAVALALALLLVGVSWNAQAREFAYVTHQGEDALHVIDVETNSLLTKIGLVGVGGGLGAAPDGREVYVNTEGGFTIIDARTNTLVARIPLPQDPEALAARSSRAASSGGGLMGVSPDGRFAYAYALRGRGLAIVDLERRQLAGTLATPQFPGAIGVSPDGSRILVAIRDTPEPAVRVYDAETNLPVGAIPLSAADPPSGPSFAFSPDGREVYLGFVHSLAVIDWREIELLATIPLEGGLGGVALSPDGTLLYIAGFSVEEIFVVDTSSRALVDSIPIRGDPSNVALTASGSKAYAASHLTNDLSVIDTATNTVTEVVPLGVSPAFVLIVDVPPPDPTPTPTPTEPPVPTPGGGRSSGGCQLGSTAWPGFVWVFALMLIASIRRAKNDVVARKVPRR